MTALNHCSFATRAVHAGERAASTDCTPVVSPIQPSVGYLYKSMDDLDAVFAAEKPGYVYPRYGSPTVTAFEAAVAALEAGQESTDPPQAHAFASGMAAIYAALLCAGVRAGACVVGALDLYGATFALLRSILPELGVSARFVDACDLDSVKAALADAQPAALLVETISNPLLKVADVPALAELAHRYHASLLVDNTFASPYLFNPLANGADFAIHSATKYLAGHGDVLAGVVVTSAENRAKLYEINKLFGGVLGPFDAWLALRGIKTLPLRLRQQCANALAAAEWLSSHPRVAHVHYPGLPEHPQHRLAQRLFREKGFGGVLSFELKDAGRDETFRFMERLQLWLPATTLGDIYSLALHPATSSHRSLTPQERLRAGMTDGLVRLSAGIEDITDLLADLDQALG